MKMRKRMGLPRVRVEPPRRTWDAAKQSVPENAVEMLREVIEEQQLAAKQRRLLERASADARAVSGRNAPSKQVEDEAPTPEKLVALLNRIAETEAARTPEQRELARKRGF